ncbi:hypothetical protein B0H14DRAFT_2559548 [Mycena olivaceomarginata]|nr:hypothetical protein B0H14DRAFT_2559548 [Mycena olivaceomarginata]
MSIFETGSNHPAPVQAYAAFLKSVDPMVASMRGPGSRAQNCKKRANREFLDGPAQSCFCSLSGPEVTAFDDGTVIVGPSRNRNPEMQKSPLEILGCLQLLKIGVESHAGSQQTHLLAQSKDVPDDGIVFKVIIDADSKTLEGPDDPDNATHLDLVKRDFEAALAGGLRLKNGKCGEALNSFAIDTIERNLFHGTAAENIELILKNGFLIPGVSPGVAMVHGSTCGCMGEPLQVVLNLTDAIESAPLVLYSSQIEMLREHAQGTFCDVLGRFVILLELAFLVIFPQEFESPGLKTFWFILSGPIHGRDAAAGHANTESAVENAVCMEADPVFTPVNAATPEESAAGRDSLPPIQDDEDDFGYEIPIAAAPGPVPESYPSSDEKLEYLDGSELTYTPVVYALVWPGTSNAALTLNWSLLSPSKTALLAPGLLKCTSCLVRDDQVSILYPSHERLAAFDSKRTHRNDIQTLMKTCYRIIQLLIYCRRFGCSLSVLERIQELGGEPLECNVYSVSGWVPVREDTGNATLAKCRSRGAVLPVPYGFPTKKGAYLNFNTIPIGNQESKNIFEISTDHGKIQPHRNIEPTMRGPLRRNKCGIEPKTSAKQKSTWGAWQVLPIMREDHHHTVRRDPSETYLAEIIQRKCGPVFRLRVVIERDPQTGASTSTNLSSSVITLSSKVDSDSDEEDVPAARMQMINLSMNNRNDDNVTGQSSSGVYTRRVEVGLSEIKQVPSLIAFPPTPINTSFAAQESRGAVFQFLKLILSNLSYLARARPPVDPPGTRRWGPLRGATLAAGPTAWGTSRAEVETL